MKNITVLQTSFEANSQLLKYLSLVVVLATFAGIYVINPFKDELIIKVEKLKRVEAKRKYKTFYFNDTKFHKNSNRSIFKKAISLNSLEDKLILSLPVILRSRAKPYLRSVVLLSQKYQVDPFWVLSVMWTESHFKPSSLSHVGAKGLMQIMPKTRIYLFKKLVKRGRHLEIEKGSFNLKYWLPELHEKIIDSKLVLKLANIELGIYYLSELYKRFNNHKYATIAYNMGPTWTRRRIVNKQPIGVKNIYLNKVNRAYRYISRRIYDKRS